MSNAKVTHISTAIDSDAQYVIDALNEAEKFEEQAYIDEQSSEDMLRSARDNHCNAAIRRRDAGLRLIEVKQSFASDTRLSDAKVGIGRPTDPFRDWLRSARGDHYPDGIPEATARRHMKLAGYTENEAAEARAKEAARKAASRAKAKEPATVIVEPPAVATSKPAQKRSAPSTIGWSDAVDQYAQSIESRLPYARNTLAQKLGGAISAKLGREVPSRVAPDDPCIPEIYDAIWCVYLDKHPDAIVGEVNEAQAAIPKSKQPAVDRAIRARTILLQTQFQTQFDAAVKAEVEKRVASRMEWINENEPKMREAKERYEEMVKQPDAFFSVEEFRMIRGLLHPDKHPGDEQRYARAFEIFNRIEACVNGIKPKNHRRIMASEFQS